MLCEVQSVQNNYYYKSEEHICNCTVYIFNYVFPTAKTWNDDHTNNYNT